MICKDSQIFNEKTKRCISITGTTAKKLYPHAVCTYKNKILNPKSRRCVKRDGKVGIKINSAAKKIQKMTLSRFRLKQLIRSEYDELGLKEFVKQYNKELSKLNDHELYVLLGERRFTNMYLNNILR